MLSVLFFVPLISCTQTETDSIKRLLKKAKYLQRKNSDSAHYFVDIAIDMALLANNDTLIAKAKNSKAVIYACMGENEQALNIFKESAVLFSNLNLEAPLARIYNNLGIVYTYLDIYDSAMFYEFKALDIYERTMDSAGMVFPFLNIAACFTKMKDYEKALQYNLKSYDIAKQVGDINGSFEVLNNIGLTYHSLDNYDSALSCYFKYLNYQLKNSNHYNLGISYNNIGLVYYDLQMNSKAIENYQMAISNFNTIGYQWGIANVYQNISDIHLRNKSYDSVIYYSELAAKEALDLDLPELRKSINYNLYSAYNNKGDSENALKYFTEFVRLKDTILDLETIQVTHELETKYQTAKKESENIRLKSQIEINQILNQRRNIIEFFIFLVFLFIVAAVVLMRKNLRQKHKIAIHETEILRQKLEFSKQEIASKALHLACQNEFRAKMLEATNEIFDNLDDNGKKAIKSLVKDLENNIDNNAWKEFEKRFEQVHKSFFDELNRRFPDLTSNDRRICAFLKLNMSTKDIALLIHRSPRSVESARYRIKKKFELSKETDLVEYLQRIA